MTTLKGNNLKNTLLGGMGDDLIYGYGDNDILFGDADNDTLKGGDGADILIGGDGNDTLNGDGGTDILLGGDGDDVYVVDNAADVTTELAGGGSDTVKSSLSWTLAANLEKLILTGTAALNGTGNALDNTLKGNAANNVLDGGAGNDILTGGLGTNTLYGGDGNDILNGGGSDFLYGGNGNDTYLIDAFGDNTYEMANGGIDTIKSSVSWYLNDNQVENLTLVGTDTSSLLGWGNALNNIIKGTDGFDELYGEAGDDILIGGWGIDNLKGGEGNDTLKVSDFDRDEIDGGKGVDSFQITADNLILDLRYTTAIKNIENIRLGDSHSTLIVDAQSVINLSNDSDTLKVDASGSSNTLKMDGGWTDKGMLDGYHTFSKGTATLLVNPNITEIEAPPLSYTISDASTAAHATSVFDSGVQEIALDFGGKHYSDWGLNSIDLTGFGLEDKLIIAQHDGGLSRGTAFYSSIRDIYIAEYYTHFGTHSGVIATDRVYWQVGGSNAKLTSFKTVSHRHRITVPTTGTTGNVTYTTVTTGHFSSGLVELTGLPVGLADSQFVFV